MNSNTVSQGTFMPNLQNMLKCQSITTTTSTSVLPTASSKLITTNSVIQSRVSVYKIMHFFIPY